MKPIFPKLLPCDDVVSDDDSKLTFLYGISYTTFKQESLQNYKPVIKTPLVSHKDPCFLGIDMTY